ncbi:MAG: hypothetical protein JNG88_02490 [Phycisphaerales bacterium]|nr:hypothetical protein [Phycisphaerales bacterium]
MSTISTPKPAAAKSPPKETIFESIASFVQFFIVLLITTRFFLPLFQIPTGSMAETLFGAHGTNTCPNCGMEYPVNCDGGINSMTITIPHKVQCPNCWFAQQTTAAPSPGQNPAQLNPAHGDRIVIHGWIYDLPWNIAGLTEPRRWDVVVFKYPPEPVNNFIKRLIGLPNETVEIVDGDIFIDGAIATKPEYAQRPLWIPVFDNNYRPAKPGIPDYWPRWVSAPGQAAWTGLDGRVFRFDGENQPAGELLFVTDPKSTIEPGVVVDKNGYNGPLVTDPRFYVAPYHAVSDVRVSAVAQIESGAGQVGFELTKYDTTFRLRVAADGGWTVLKRVGNSSDWTECRRGTVARAAGRSVPVALGIADYQVVAEVDGARVYESDDAQYSISLEQARDRSLRPARPRIAISAERVVARLSNVAIHRDVFYTNDIAPPGHELHAGLGHPFKLDGDDYFVLGDNSRASSDARVWSEVGPHLLDAAAAGEHRPGTIPRDQLLGRAFFVYWPGVRTFAGKLPVLPNFGDIRWIR